MDTRMRGMVLCAAAGVVLGGAGCNDTVQEQQVGRSTGALDIVEVQKITGSEAAAGDELGREMAASDFTLIAGSEYHGAYGTKAGVAWIFVRNGDSWLEQAELIGSQIDPYDRFGSAVAVSGDTAVVGAVYDELDGIRTGAAYVYERRNTTWTEAARLTPSDPDGQHGFGDTVVIDGDTIVVGATAHGDYSEGAAYVFVRDGSDWIEQAKIVPAGLDDYDVFSAAMALDGDTLVVGTPNRDTPDVDYCGVVWVYVREDGVWSLQTTLTASDAHYAQRFGNKVAMQGDTLLIGASGDSELGAHTGAAYVFVRSGTTWTEQTKLSADDVIQDRNFGRRVALDGNIALITASSDHEMANYAGAGYVFEHNNGEWTQSSKITASDAAASDWLGFGAALERGMALLGAPGEDDRGSRAGAVYAFSLGTETCPSGSEAGSWDFCTPGCPCDDGGADCDSDADCAIGLRCVHDVGVDYGYSDPELDVCTADCPSSEHVGSSSFCTPECPCDDGEGDCDSDADCAEGLHCWRDVGVEYGYSDPELDVCVTGCPDVGVGGSRFCTTDCPCEAGEGDCDSDSECAAGLECSWNVGASYGFESDVDVCEPID